MMDASREELAAAERTAWTEFLALIARVPEDRRDVREVVPGWSVKDLMWHNAGWALFAAEELQKMDGGPFTDPFDAHDDDHWDRVSAAQVESGRTLDWDQTLAECEARRARVHEMWAGLGDVVPAAADWFSEETAVHYREHAEEIERFLEA